MTITEFLEARISQDEDHARKLAETDRRPILSLANTINHPQRLLAECAAKRAIISRHKPDRALENWYWLRRKCAECGNEWHKYVSGALPTDIGPEQGCATLRAIASVYSDHPDYQEAWQGDF